MSFPSVTIGPATLYLGNCLEVMPTLEKADHVISDPPYDDIMQKNFSRVGRTSNRLGERGPLEFDSIDAIRPEAARLMVAACSGWVVAFCIAEGVRAWRDELQASGARYKRALVWVKTNAMPQFNGQGPSAGHESMVSAWCGPGHSRWNGGGKPGTYTFPTCGGGAPGSRASYHPTQKPLPLMLSLVNDFSDPGQLVLDPFAGAGTTGLACLRSGRRFIGIEQDEKWFDVAVKRLREANDQAELLPMAAAPAGTKAKQGKLFSSSSRRLVEDN